MGLKLTKSVEVAKKDRPLNFEDLPNDVLGVITGKLCEWSGDRFRLTQASPSVRRICRGPKAHPGILGNIGLGFDADQDKPVSNPYPYSFRLNPLHEAFSSELPHLLRWMASRAKAFAVVGFFQTPRRSEFPDKSIIAQAISSLLQALSEASFKGELCVECLDFGDEAFTREIVPVLLSWCSEFPENRKGLHIDSAPTSSPDVAKLLQEMGVQRLELTSFGPFPPGALSKCEALDTLILSCDGITSGLAFPSTLRALKRLKLDGILRTLDLSALFRSLSPSSRAFLRAVSLGSFAPEEIVPRLSVLESLPNLKSLCITVDLVSDSEDSPSSSARLALPSLEHLGLGFMVSFESDEDEDEPMPVTESFRIPLRLFSCPSVRLISLHAEYFDAFEDADEPPMFTALASLDPLDGFPGLRCLTVRNWFSGVGGGADAVSMSVDLSRVDFRAVPHLACLSIRGGSIEGGPPNPAEDSEDPRALPLPQAEEPGIFGDQAVQDHCEKRWGTFEDSIDVTQ